MKAPLVLAMLLASAHAAAQPYESAFDAYQPYKEPVVTDWKTTNARVSAPEAPAKADPHAGHKMDKPAPQPDSHAGHNHL